MPSTRAAHWKVRTTDAVLASSSRAVGSSATSRPRATSCSTRARAPARATAPKSAVSTSSIPYGTSCAQPWASSVPRARTGATERCQPADDGRLLSVAGAELLQRERREEGGVRATCGHPLGERVAMRLGIHLVGRSLAALERGTRSRDVDLYILIRHGHRLRRRERRAQAREQRPRVRMRRVVLHGLLEPRDRALLVLQVVERHARLRVAKGRAIHGHRSQGGQSAGHLDGARPSTEDLVAAAQRLEHRSTAWLDGAGFFQRGDGALGVAELLLEQACDGHELLALLAR